MDHLVCEECGDPHLFDVSIPSEMWNKIAKPYEILCLWCIDNRLAEAGLSCEGSFYFVGKALVSKSYTGDSMAVEKLAQRAMELYPANWSEVKWRERDVPSFADAVKTWKTANDARLFEHMKRESLEYYLSLQYPIEVYKDNECGGFVVLFPDLPGCFTQIESLDELEYMADDARKGWIKVAYEDGQDIPLPTASGVAFFDSF